MVVPPRYTPYTAATGDKTTSRGNTDRMARCGKNGEIASFVRVRTPTTLSLLFVVVVASFSFFTGATAASSFFHYPQTRRGEEKKKKAKAGRTFSFRPLLVARIVESEKNKRIGLIASAFFPDASDEERKSMVLVEKKSLRGKNTVVVECKWEGRTRATRQIGRKKKVLIANCGPYVEASAARQNPALGEWKVPEHVETMYSFRPSPLPNDSPGLSRARFFSPRALSSFRGNFFPKDDMYTPPPPSYLLRIIFLFFLYQFPPRSSQKA